MPIIPAKCTNCGASLEIDSAKDAAVCPYCGSAFIVEKAINNYNTTNHISANTVNIYGGNAADFTIQAGTLKKYNGASTEVVIPDSVTIIGDNAFKNCTGLTNITIPNSVTNIGLSAFECCSSLTNITIPGGVTVIGHNAFCNCRGLASITIPNSVRHIESHAFEYCTGLISITLSNRLESIAEKVFKNCSSLASITIPDSVTEISYNAFEHCTSLTNITISGGVTRIMDHAFSYCSALTNVTIPNSVTLINYEAFKDCTVLASITIPDSVTSIMPSAFSGCPIQTVNASEEWKKAHCDSIPCLASYKSGGCYIATAVYGSYDCPQVWTLRRFRDNTLARTWYGRAFIRVYYAVSPTLVRWFGRREWFRKLWKRSLDRMVGSLNEKGVESTPYNDRHW